MKSSIKHGAVVRCDMVTVTGGGTVHRNECGGRFITYSVSSLAREQAKNAGWSRPKVGRVRWPGEPPMADARKVDLCPTHAKCVMTEADVKAAKAMRKAERKKQRDAERAEKKAEKARQKTAARDVAKAVKAKNARKKKAKADAETPHV